MAESADLHIDQAAEVNFPITLADVVLGYIPTNIKDDMPFARLLQATFDGDIDTIRQAIADPETDLSAHKNLLLLNSARHGQAELVRLLRTDSQVIARGNYFRIGGNQEHLLTAAAREGHTNVMQVLLEDPTTDPSESYNEPLRKAVAGGQTDAVQFLLADPRVDSSTNMVEPLMRAYHRRKIDVLHHVLTHPRTNLNEGEPWEMLMAIESDDPTSIQAALANPELDPSANRNLGLLYAVRFGKSESVRLLLSDPRVRESEMPWQLNNQEHTPFKLAAEHGQLETARILLQAAMADQAIPLHAALRAALVATHTPIIELLIQDSRVNGHPEFHEWRELLTNNRPELVARLDATHNQALQKIEAMISVHRQQGINEAELVMRSIRFSPEITRDAFPFMNTQVRLERINNLVVQLMRSDKTAV